MVRLYEYQGKCILRDNGVPVPEGYVISSVDDLPAILSKVGKSVALKAQLLTTGRLKAGGIRFATTIDEAISIVSDMLGKEIKGMRVDKVLVEERLEIAKEFFVSITVSDSYKIKGPILLFSTEGGVNIEEVAEKHPEKILTMPIDYLKGIDRIEVKEGIMRLGVPEHLADQLTDFVAKLYDIFKKYDAHTVEVNPLVLTKNGRLLAADCRITIDDSSVYRHPELGIEVPRDIVRPITEFEKVAWKIEESDYRGVCYFMQFVGDINELARGGYVAFHGIGGGACMLASEVLLKRGFKLATYLDTSGNPTAFKVYRGMKVSLSLPGIEGYYLAGAVIANQEQWYHGFAIVKVFREYAKYKPGFPVVILIAGNKEAETHRIIMDGLRDVPLKWELYGRDKVLDIDFITDKFSKLMEDYKKEGVRTIGSIMDFVEARAPSEDELKDYVWFKTSTGGEVYVNLKRCIAPNCGFACVKACRWMGAGALKVESGKPSLVSRDPEALRRLCSECLACEYYCMTKGGSAIRIVVPVHGLADVVSRYLHLYR
ncbi:MAG: ATP-grasp domain-containing protein [Candidatus Nezhaarchaeales archaeon]